MNRSALIFSLLTLVTQCTPTIAFDVALPKFRQNALNQTVRSQKASLAKAKELKEVYIELLDEIEASMVYWESIDYHPLRFLISRSPLHWITGKKRSKVRKNNLEVLEDVRTKIHVHLGTLYTLSHNCSTFPTTESFKELETFLQDQLNGYTSVDHYKNVYFKKLHPWSQPGHFHRNWLPYTIGAIGTTALIIYAYNNQDIIYKTIHDAKLYTKNFYANNIKKPCKDIKEVLFEGNKSDYQQLKEGQQIIQVQVKDYLNDTRNPEHIKLVNKNKGYTQWGGDLAAKGVGLGPNNYEPLTQEQINLHVEKAKHGDIELVNKDWTAETPNSMKNFVKGNTARQGKIIGQKFLNEFYDLKVKFSGIIALATMIPAYFFTHVSLKIGKKLYHTISPEKIIPQQIKKSLIQLRYGYNQVHSTHSNSLHELGTIVYHHHKLEKYLHFVPSEDRAQFKRDITSFLDDKLTNEQKFNIITIMFDRYTFLRV